MKKKFSVLMNCLLVTISLFAQIQKFDILNFVPPAGWQRLDSNGKVGFFDTRTSNGATHFCQILLYPSHSSSGNYMNDFKEEWSNRIVMVTGATKNPGIERKKLPDGWDMVTGYANITQGGGIYTCMLTTISGFGKEISILVNVSGQDYLPDVEQFFKNLTLNKEGDNNSVSDYKTTLPVPGNTFANYNFNIPQGWTATQYPDGMVLSSPVTNTGEKCNITLWPMRTFGGNLQADGEALFARIFKDFNANNGSTANSIINGISAQGWEYYITKKSIVLRGCDYQAMFGFAFVAKLGNQEAAITGISKDPLVSSCFGLQLTDVWPKFFYSLQFLNWPSQNSETSLSKYLPGVWIAVTATSGDRFAFAPNGRFAGAAASQKYYLLNSMEVLRVTDAYFGDGSYSLKGNTIVLVSDNDRNRPENGLLRIEKESKDGGRLWVDKLYLLRKSPVDNSEYEVCYEKQK